jgi:phosphopantetheine adenylyltransferase
MNWLKLQDYFGFDYAFDDLHLGHLHMIAIQIPKDYKGAYAKFKTSEFSKMYDYEALNQFFKGREEELKVLVKDEMYQIDFVAIINKEFNTTVDHLSWTGELDFTLKQEEEYFHKSIK